jgi:hypothetical protein
MAQAMANVVKQRVAAAARQLGAADPLPYVGKLIERTFPLPQGAAAYANNTLTPGAAPFEPSYSEREPGSLRFTLSPLEPGAPASSRRSEATQEMRRLVSPVFGRDALRWFDRWSEDWRGLGAAGRLHFGAWFGTSYDGDGLSAAKIYYEMQPEQVESLPASLKLLVRSAAETVPGLKPIFTSIRCGRDCGHQRVTFHHQGPLSLSGLAPLLNRLGLAHQLPSIMQIVGLCLGGRFDLPEGSVLLGIGNSDAGPELKIEILLSMIPDVPAGFLELLGLALSERPRELNGLSRWLRAFTPDEFDWPGEFSVLSIRVTPNMPARVSLYLRPVEFEIHQQMAQAQSA